METTPNQVILNRSLMERYAIALCSAYDELFELNLTKNTYQTIFYTPHKHLLPEHRCETRLDISEIANDLVYAEDHEAFLNFFSAENLEKLFYHKLPSVTVDFRHKMEGENYTWVQATVLPVKNTDEKIVLCYLMDIHTAKQAALKDLLGTNEENTLFKAFSSVFISIAILDLKTGESLIEKSPAHPEFQGRIVPWEQLRAHYLGYVHKSDLAIARNEFTLPKLRLFFESGQKSKTMEIRSQVNGSSFQWIEISSFLIDSDNDKKILLTTRNIDNHKMLQNIVDRYVFQNCDYFVCIDAKNDTYTVINGNETSNDIALPSLTSTTYSEELLRYNKKYIVPKDLEMSTYEMSIPHVLEVLETQDEHSFYLGVITPTGAYRRKRIQFIYYDKPNQMILLTRTDVTQIYFDEKEKRARLQAAIKEARTDSLTGLFNHKTLGKLIGQSLRHMGSRQAALLFIDLDHFKLVNDNFGHLRGDRLLKDVAQIFQETISYSGLVGRVGGDEFIIFLPNVSSAASVKHYIERIYSSFERLLDEELKKIALSCSIGISLYPKNGITYDTLAQRADQSLYHAKNKGKNCYVFYDDKIQEESYESIFSKIDS